MRCTGVCWSGRKGSMPGPSLYSDCPIFTTECHDHLQPLRGREQPQHLRAATGDQLTRYKFGAPLVTLMNTAQLFDEPQH